MNSSKKFSRPAHTAEETVKWLLKRMESAQQRFDEFTSVLKKRAAIPAAFLSSRSIDETGCNPTFRFLRPSTLLDIINAGRGFASKRSSGSSKLRTIESKVLVPFEKCWFELFNNLDEYYGNESSTILLREKFDQLRFTSGVFKGGASRFAETALHENPNLNLDICDDEYADALREFKLEFAKLSRYSKPSSSRGVAWSSEGFSPTTTEYSVDDLMGYWALASLRPQKKFEFQIPRELSAFWDSCTMVVCEEYVLITVKMKDRRDKTYKFMIPSDAAKAFINLLIEYPRGVLKPIIRAKRGKCAGKPVRKDFRLYHFNSRGKDDCVMPKYATYHFWRFFIIPASENVSDRMVKLGLNAKYALKTGFSNHP